MFKSAIILIFIVCTCITRSYAQTVNTVIQTSLVQEVLYYVNQYRKSHNLTALKLNTNISQEALHHSQNMAAHRSSFGHNLFSKRVQRLRHILPKTNAWAENVAYAYKDGNDVVSNWVKSPDHRKNILGSYNLTGIGIARDKQGKLYFTQIFMHDTKVL